MKGKRSLMLTDTSWPGFGHGALALAAAWWAWSCYVCLPNTTVTAPALDRTLILLAMAAMLVAAVALPQAFASASFLFACVLMAVRVLHVVLFIRSTREAPAARVLQRLIPSLLAGPALILAAAFGNSPYRELMWLAAVAVDVSGPLVAASKASR
jgi:low temperature requirement protein LtrA